MTLDFQTLDSLTVPTDSTAAAEIAAALPHSAVLKAFNTNFAAALTAYAARELIAKRFGTKVTLRHIRWAAAVARYPPYLHPPVTARVRFRGGSRSWSPWSGDA